MPVLPLPIAAAETWLKVATKLGVQSAIAGYLVYNIVIHTQATGDETLKLVREHAVMGVVLSGSVQQLVNVSLQNCVNTAGKDEAKRDRCFASLFSPPQR